MEKLYKKRQKKNVICIILASLSVGALVYGAITTEQVLQIFFILASFCFTVLLASDLYAYFKFRKLWRKYGYVILLQEEFGDDSDQS